MLHTLFTSPEKSLIARQPGRSRKSFPEPCRVPCPAWRIAPVRGCKRSCCSASDAADEFGQTGIVRVRNNTGFALPRFCVLALSEPLIGPAANLQEFKNKVNYEGVVPAKNGHKGKFAVLLEPLDGKAIEPPTPVGGWSQAAHRQFANSLDLG